MSRAFVKEQDGEPEVETLPDRLVSTHPNLVTAEGLSSIEAEIAALEQARDAARAADDKLAQALAQRDLRYWASRHATAQVQPTPPKGEAQFGARITIRREDGREQTFRIVGEDEADPARHSVSYVSPLARAVIGKGVGEAAMLNGAEIEIVAIG
ncbi:MAG: transcription elongation factor GreA [Alphaproteobacteria bacterium]